MDAQLQDEDWLDAKLRDEMPYIDDDGFTSRVSQELPVRRRSPKMRSAFLLSVSVVAAIIAYVVAGGGSFVMDVLGWFAVEPIAFLQESGWFRTIFISSGIWQSVGWGSIIYLSAISGIDPSLYEAAKVDGASRWKQTIHITLPGIASTVIILLILQIGNFMAVGTDKILLLYNSSTYETADVIGTFVYRKGILESNFSYSAAVGLFNSVINFILLIMANALSRRTSETKLW